MRKKSKWISVEENLPKEGQLVLALYNKSSPKVVYRQERENINDRWIDTDSQWIDADSGHSLISPNYWMIIPELNGDQKMESLIKDLELNHEYCSKDVILNAAAALRQLHAENEALKRAVFGLETKLGVRGYELQIADLVAENEALRADAERLDWIQAAADQRKVEIAKSLLGTGYEIGEWPSMRVTVTSGTLRVAIDAARGEK